MDRTYQYIFTPLVIWGITLKNRIEIVSISMFDLDATPERHPSKRDMQLFCMRTVGGAAAVTLGDCIVDLSGEGSGKLASPKILMGREDNLPFLAHTADEIHRYGAVASIKLNYTDILRASVGVQAWGPDYVNLDEARTIASLPNRSAPNEPIYHGSEMLFMTGEMIEAVVDAFGRAAEQAKTYGFEVVMIHVGHGWLIRQFLSPLTNHRTDHFDGSLKNRVRLLLMTIDRIRQHYGEDFLIKVRFSGTEYVEGDYTPKRGVELAKLMDGKADLLHVSVCNFYFPETECLMVSGMFKEGGHSLYLAEEIKKHVKRSHVVSVGAHRDPGKIEDTLTTGEVDMIAVYHTVNADLQFVSKFKRNQEEEIRPRLRCNACIANYQTRTIKCAIDPTLGRPEDEAFPFLPTTSKRVLTVGGGPTGLEAAIVARDQGHGVILCEKTGTLSGLFRYIREVPFKWETQQYVDYMIAKAVRMDVDIRLNTEAIPELMKVIAPDFCITTVGSEALIPPISGVEKTHPVMDIHDDGVQVRQKVVIIGSGLTGTEVALELAIQGKRVTLVEMSIDVAHDTSSTHKPALMTELKDHTEQTTILCRTTRARIHDHGIVCGGTDGKEFTLDAGTVILAAGMALLRAEALILESASSELRTVGDYEQSRQILEAVCKGYDAAMEV